MNILAIGRTNVSGSHSCAQERPRNLNRGTFLLLAGIAIALTNFSSIKILNGPSNIVQFSLLRVGKCLVDLKSLVLVGFMRGEARQSL